MGLYGGTRKLLPVKLMQILNLRNFILIDVWACHNFLFMSDKICKPFVSLGFTDFTHVFKYFFNDAVKPRE